MTDTRCEVVTYMYNLAYTMSSHLFSFWYFINCTILLPLVIFIYFTLSVLSLTTVSLYLIPIPEQTLGGTAFITVLSAKRFQCLKRPSVTTLLWGLLQWHLNIVPLLLMAEDGRRLFFFTLKWYTLCNSAHKSTGSLHSPGTLATSAESKVSLKGILGMHQLNTTLKTHSHCLVLFCLCFQEHWWRNDGNGITCVHQLHGNTQVCTGRSNRVLCMFDLMHEQVLLPILNHFEQWPYTFFFT